MGLRSLLGPIAIAVVAILVLLTWWPNSSELQPPLRQGDRDAIEDRPVVVGDHPTNRTAIDAEPRYALTGAVHGAAGIPLDGARIVIRRGAPEDRAAIFATAMAQWIEGGDRNALFLAPSGPILASSTLTGDGERVRFRIEDLSERHLRVTIEHDYYALPEALSVHVDPEASEHHVGTLEPLAGGKVVGTVTPDGTRPEVRLVAEFDPADMMLAPARLLSLGMRSGTRSAQVAADGRFEFRAVWPSHETRLAARIDEMYALAGPFEVRAGETTEVDLTMATGRSLAIRVVDEADAPVADARVRARATSTTGIFSRSALAQSNSTRRDGTCTLRALADEPHEVSVSAPGFLAAARTIEPADFDRGLVVTLARGGSVRGVVVDPAGQGVADAGVAWHESVSVPVIGDISSFFGTDLMCAEARSARCRTDAEGSFVLSGIPTGTEHVTLVAAHDDWIGGIAPRVRVGASDATISLRSPARIIGRVSIPGRDESIPTFTVETRVPMALFIDRPSRAVAVEGSDDGTFALERVPPGRATLRVHAPGFAPVDRRIRAREGETLDVGSIPLHRGVTVRGRVVDDDGQPVAGATVRRKLNGIGDNPLFAPFLQGPGERTDEDGTFELTCLATGRFALIATADGYARGESRRLAAEVGDTFDVEIRLDSGGSVEGRLILDPEDDYADWAIFPESHSTGAARLIRPNPDGTFRIDALDPGRYNISAFDMATAPSLAERFIDGSDAAGMIRDMVGGVVLRICTVRAGETTEVELDASGRRNDGSVIRGTVSIGGQPLDDGWVETERITGRRTMLSMAIVENGRFTVRGAHPGTYVLQVRRGIFMAPVGDPQTVHVTTQDTTTLDIDFPGGSVRGRVIHGISGEPLAGAVVKLVSAEERGGADAVGFGFEVTDQDGAFAFLGLNAGTYTLIADEHLSPSSDSRSGGRLEGLHLTSDAVLDNLELRANPSAGIAVSVTDSRGSPLARATIVAVDASGRSVGTLPLAFSNTDGRAHLAGLPAGETRIIARREGYAPGFSETTYVSPGAHVRRAVVLERGVHVIARVVDRDGATLRNAVVSIRPGDGPWIAGGLLSTKPLEDGRIDLGQIAPGPTEFAVTHPVAGEFTLPLTIATAASQTIELRRP